MPFSRAILTLSTYLPPTGWPPLSSYPSHKLILPPSPPMQRTLVVLSVFRFFVPLLWILVAVLLLLPVLVLGLVLMLVLVLRLVLVFMLTLVVVHIRTPRQ